MAVLFLCSNAFAQTWSTPVTPTKISLREALVTAEANYPRVKLALQQKAAAHDNIALARTAFLPKLDVLWQINRASANNVYGLLLPQSVVPSISGPVLPTNNTQSAWNSAGGMLLSWQPFDFGVRRDQVNAAIHGSNAASADVALTKLELQSSVAAAYFDLATAEQLAVVALSSVERLETFSKTVHVLTENQLRPGADATQADAVLARTRTMLILAQTEVEVRRATLAGLMGTPEAKVEAESSLLLSLPPNDEAGAEVLPTHPSLKIEDALIHQQLSQLSAITHSYVPQFRTEFALSGRGAGTALSGPFPGGASGLAPDTMNWAAGIQVYFPVFDIFNLRAQKKVQQDQVNAGQVRLHQAENELNVAVRQAQARLNGAQAVLNNTPIELEAARQNELQQHTRFTNALATVVEVAEAENVLALAESDDGVAKINVWRMQAALAAARGDLGPFLEKLPH